MESARGKICPINGGMCCTQACAWWCHFAQDCAVPLIAGILADSEINRITWKNFKYCEKEEQKRGDSEGGLV